MEKNHRFCARLLLLAAFAFAIPGFLVLMTAPWAAAASFLVSAGFSLWSMKHHRKVAYYRSRR
jgi:hypothetical protein